MGFGSKTNSVGIDLFLHAEPRRRSELLHGVLDGGVCALPGGKKKNLPAGPRRRIDIFSAFRKVVISCVV